MSNNDWGSTMNLFPMDDKNGCVGRTINLFPPSSGLDRPFLANPRGSKRVSTEPSTAPMTIFFRGQVFVFKDMPCDKAKEVLDMASRFESVHKKRRSVTAYSDHHPSRGLNNVVIPASLTLSPIANAFDLPIARKASLQRFLEKRKDRLAGKATSAYDISSGAPLKPVKSKSWLGLASMPVFQDQQHHP